MTIFGTDDPLKVLAARIGMLNNLLNTGYPGDMFKRVITTLRDTCDEVLKLDIPDDSVVRASTGDWLAQQIMLETDVPESPEGLFDEE